MAHSWRSRSGGDALRFFASVLLFFLVPRVYSLRPLSSAVAAATGLAAESPLPFVLMHGIGDECKRPGVVKFVHLLEQQTGMKAFCIEIGDGVADSWTMRLDRQVAIACQKIKATPELAGGFNMLGLSQGAVIGRAYIETCDDAPKVHNFVSMGGPHAGVASIPLCSIPVWCRFLDTIIAIGVYSPYVQEHIAPTGYLKIPTDLKAYYHGCFFLPTVNNEVAGRRNETYRQRFAALNQLVLIMFESDTVLFPRETSQFGYYPPGSFSKVLPANETELYKEDWIGLRALDEAGRVRSVSVAGNHLSVTQQTISDYVVPYLVPAGGGALRQRAAPPALPPGPALVFEAPPDLLGPQAAAS